LYENLQNLRAAVVVLVVAGKENILSQQNCMKINKSYEQQ
jgi:hypothetical protein